MEIDAYCFSKIAENAGYTSTTTIGYQTGNEKPVEALNAGLLYMEEHEVPAENQIIFASPKFINELRNDTTELSRFLMQADYDKDVKFRLTSYEGRKIAVVAPQRFRTKIDLSGHGVAWGSDSKPIDFMIVAKDAVMHVVKYNKVKILSGDVVLAGANFDGYEIFARIYHDVFVPDNKKVAIYAHVGQSTSILPVNIEFDTTNNKIAKLEANDPATSVKFYKVSNTSTNYATLSAYKVGDILDVKATDISVAKVGETIVKKNGGTNGTVVYAVEDGNRIIAKKLYE